MTGPILADFVRALARTGVFDPGQGDYFHVKFGRSIDKDEKSTTIYEPIAGIPSISTVRSIPWDIEHSHIPQSDAIALLKKHDRSLYRASVSLGMLRKDLFEALQTPRPDDGQMNLGLWDCHVILEPVELSTLDGDDTFLVGWMSVSISGNGYCFPWTPRDLTSRAASLNTLRPMTEVCRQFFPVDPAGTPNVMTKLSPALRRRKVRAMRKRMGDLWPFEDLDREWDWFWGVSET